MKKCKNCNSIVPDDSAFCPFCGSSEIEEQKEEIQKTFDNLGGSKDDQKSYKGAFIATLIGCVVLGIVALSLYGNLSNTNNNNGAPANSSVNTYSDSIYKDKYEEVRTIANQDVSAYFHPNSFFVKGTNTKIKIYCDINEAAVEWSGTYYGSTLDTNTFSDWYYDDNNIPYFYLTVKCSADAYGTITFTNDRTSDKFTIFFSGN